MKLLSIKSFSATDPRLEFVWKRIESECECTVFQSYEWFQRWYKFELKRQKKLKIFIYIVYRKQDDPVALFPLELTSHGPANLMRFAGRDLAEYKLPLIIENKLTSEERVNLWKIVISEMPPHDAFLIERYPLKHQNIPKQISLEKINALKAGEVESVSSCKHENIDLFFNNISKRMVKDNKRYTRRLKECGKLEYKSLYTEEEYTEIFTKISISLERKARSLGISFTEKIYSLINFYTSFNDYSDASNSSSYLIAITLDKQVLAACWALKYKEVLYYLYPGYMDTPYIKYSPGRLLLEHLINRAFENGVKAIDFTLGKEPYKYNWAGKDNFLVDYVKPTTFIGLIYYIYRRLVNYIKTNLYILTIARFAIRRLESVLNLFKTISKK